LASAVIGEYQKECRQINDMSRLVSPFPDGAEHHERLECELGSVRFVWGKRFSREWIIAQRMKSLVSLRQALV
jgi:hypothetical protein